MASQSLSTKTPAAQTFDPSTAIRKRKYGQLLAILIIAFFAADLAYQLSTNDNISYEVIAEYLFSASILSGLMTTFQLTVVSMVGGVALGLLVAIARMSDNRLLRSLAVVYIWFFRGVPLLVMVLIWGNFGLLFTHLQVSVPFTEIVFVEAETNRVITSFVAACLALILHEAAYMAEIVRGGLLSVGSGQREAAAALGMRGSLSMRRIVLPQALRMIIPPTGNQMVLLLKATSLVYVIAGGDVMTMANNISADNYRVIELLVVASIWYLLVVSVLSVGQKFLEQRFGRGYNV